MSIDLKALKELEASLDSTTQERLTTAVDRMVSAKAKGKKIVVVTGSGPNVHEGVTTLLAELMRLGVVDGVSTSSAVISHEMGGVLDKVKRVDGRALNLPGVPLPHGNHFELTLLEEAALQEIEKEIPIDRDLIRRLQALPGDTIIKAAGNLGYPMGLYMEHCAPKIRDLALSKAASFEEIAGLGSDERTLIGIGAKMKLPVIVTVPQLVGGGAVGLAIGDSISITERSRRLADLLAGADVIIESAVVLTQEVHDGPFETYTGHGLWACWQNERTYSLQGKTLIRIDLDQALDTVWLAQRQGSTVQDAINKGLPKTKTMKVPFRMEMSGFARLEGSIPLVGDIGAIWPLLAHMVTQRLGLSPEFMSYPQQTPQGQAMRGWIVNTIAPFSMKKLEG